MAIATHGALLTEQSFHPQGVLHAGAVLDSGVIANIGPAAVRTEFAAKVAGAAALLRRTWNAPVQALNLFSSLAAFSGSGGQGSYAAANGVLDAWAQSLQVCCSARLPFCCCPYK